MATPLLTGNKGTFKYVVAKERIVSNEGDERGV